MSGLRFEAEITPGMAPAEVAALATQVERAGFDRLGISDVVLWHDCWVLMTLCAAATERLEIGPLVTNPYSRHPVVLAGAVATLGEASGGRAFLGLGVGAGLEQFGMDYPRPVRTLREAVRICRGLWAGEEVTFSGEVFSADRARLKSPPAASPALVLGSRSPGVMRLAGELSDRVLIGARYWSVAQADEYRGWLAEGAARVDRPLESLEISPRLTVCISADGDLARRSVKRYVAHYLSILRPPDLDLRPGLLEAVDAALAEARGWYFDHGRHDPPALFDLIDDDLVERFAVAGTPAECVEQMRRISELGFDSFSLNLAAVARQTMYGGLAETIDGAARVLATLRAA
ncbi:MAG: LLM class flavin-dependent oxidoreductase [bacterium]|nr:LLM class flavin-dependent oxidoreductase [bacterium]